MIPTVVLEEFDPLLARHERAVLFHLCQEIARSGHPDDLRTAQGVAILGAALAHQAIRQLYCPHIKLAALDALYRIHEARRRLQRGRYGFCHDCGTPLEAQWLRRHPAGLRCEPCLATWKQALVRGPSSAMHSHPA